MRECPHCGGVVARRFRFCPWCAGPLRLKLVEFFRPHPAIESDRRRALRVSRYFGTDSDPAHVRFSVWSQSEEGAQADAAVSLDEREAARLARFLATGAVHRPRPFGVRELLAQLRR